MSRNSTRKPLNLIKSPIFTNTPCESTCLYNAPSMHTVDRRSPRTSQKLPCGGNLQTQRVIGQLLRSLLQKPQNFSEVAPEVHPAVHTAFLCRNNNDSGKKKRHKHKLFGPDFPRTFLTLTPGCPGVKKFLPPPLPQENALCGADVHDFRRGHP